MNTEELVRQIETLEKRGAELHRQIEAATREVAQNQAAMIDGEPGAAEAAAVAEARLSSHQGALRILNERLGHVRTQLQEARYAAHVESVAAQMREQAQLAAAAHDDYVRALVDLHEAMATAVARVKEATERRHMARQQFDRLGRGIAPDPDDLRRLHNRLSREVNITVVTERTEVPPIGPYAEAVHYGLSAAQAVDRREEQRKQVKRKHAAV